MLTEYMARLGAALEALQRFQSNDDANRDYFRPFELALYEAVQDGALDLLDHLRDVESAKREVRRRYPYAVAAPAEVRESCPPSVRTWRIVDLGTGRVAPLPGDAPTEEEAWTIAARACERRGRAAPPPLASTRADLRRALDELDALRSEPGYEDGDHVAMERDLLDEIATLARAVVDGGAE